MTKRDQALRQIEEITEVMRSSFTTALPANLFITIGVGLILIPFCEMFFSMFLDPWLFSLCGSIPVIFVLRTVFYWTSFALASRYFVRREDVLHPAIKRAWAVSPWFPLIPLATAAMLWVAGYAPLIKSIVLILIGCYFGLIGRFAQPVINVLACSYIVVGIGSIYLVSLNIPNLWWYLLWFQGLSCAATGVFLRANKS